MLALITVSVASALKRFPFEIGLLLALMQPASANAATRTIAIQARETRVRFTPLKSAAESDYFRLSRTERYEERLGVMAASEHKCASCAMRKRAEENPNSLRGRLWRWHTSWCPGWKAYQRSLADEK